MSKLIEEISDFVMEKDTYNLINEYITTGRNKLIYK